MQYTFYLFPNNAALIFFVKNSIKILTFFWGKQNLRSSFHLPCQIHDRYITDHVYLASFDILQLQELESSSPVMSIVKCQSIFGVFMQTVGIV